MTSSDKLKSIQIRDFLKKHFKSLFFVILLTIIVSIITYLRILIQIDIGPLSDSIDFFTNALVFAGQGFGYSDLIRPPFFSFITSLFVRMGYMSINTIFIVDGLFFIFGVIGFYLLLKIRFNEFESFLGSLIYATFPIVIAVLGVGFSDFASISLTIWTIYFTILAVQKDSRFFYLSFPFAMLAFLARYNSVLIIFPIFLYIFIKWDEISAKTKNLRNLLIGIIISLTGLIPPFIFYYIKFGNILYPFINFAGTASNPVSPQNASFNPNLLFYIQNFPFFIGISGVLILLIIAVGILVYGSIRMKRNFGKKNESKQDIKDILQKLTYLDKITKIKLTFFTILLLAFLGTFGQIFYIISEALFFVLIYILYNLLKNRTKYLDIDILFLTWFMAFFIFHSIYLLKDNRYFIIMAPPVAYFLLVGLNEISNRVKFKIKNINLTLPIIALILIVVMMMSTVSDLPVVHQANIEYKVNNEQIENISEWFVTYDPNYKNKNIYSDIWPNFSWYLKTNVKIVPFFKDNMMYTSGVKNSTISSADSVAFNNYLVDNNADYYLSVRNGINLTSYIPIKQFNNLIVYKKKTL